VSALLRRRLNERLAESARAKTLRWEPADCILYALSVGARPPAELDLVYERYGPVVLPTMATRFANAPLEEVVRELARDYPSTLMFASTVTCWRPLPSSGTVDITASVTRCLNRGRHLVVSLSVTGWAESTAPLSEVQYEIWVRAAAAAGNAEYEDSEPEVSPSAGDREWRAQIRPEQNALFRLQEDLGPSRPPDIHIDPEYAQQAGLERPSLFGECLTGFVGRAVRDTYDLPPGPLSLRTRYLAPAYPDTEIAVCLRRSGNAVAGTVVGTDGQLATVSADLAPAPPALSAAT
jgi:acyl dehydratase